MSYYASVYVRTVLGMKVYDTTAGFKCYTRKVLETIDLDKVKMKVYVLMGFIVALASIVQVSRLRGVDVASAGSGYEMNAIAAVVVGGNSASGGSGVSANSPYRAVARRSNA